MVKSSGWMIPIQLCERGVWNPVVAERLRHSLDIYSAVWNCFIIHVILHHHWLDSYLFTRVKVKTANSSGRWQYIHMHEIGRSALLLCFPVTFLTLLFWSVKILKINLFSYQRNNFRLNLSATVYGCRFPCFSMAELILFLPLSYLT